MSSIGFCLQPFTKESPGEACLPFAFDITGKIARRDKWLSLDCLVAGQSTKSIFPRMPKCR